MLRSKSLPTIALALVFPITLLTAQQSGTKSNIKKPDLFKNKHFVQLAHKPELVAKNHTLSDDEKRDVIQTALTRITRKKTTSRISVDSTLVLTPKHAIDTNDFYLVAQSADFDPSKNYLAFAPYNSSTGNSGIGFMITVKANTMYTLVLDVDSYSATFTVQGAGSGQGEPQSVTTQTTTANTLTSTQLLYTFDAASAGQIGITAWTTEANGGWQFKKAELIATPLD